MLYKLEGATYLGELSARVLLVLPQDVLDRARALAGKTTAAYKLPVSLQVVLRALIEEALKRDDHPGLLSNIERQAQAVRQRRRTARAVGTRRGARSGRPARRT
jgi:hypothetical protein